MKDQIRWNVVGHRLGQGFAACLVGLFMPLAAQAGKPSQTATCNALVSVGGNLYLADESGSVLTQFTADATPKIFVTLSPDGKRVAYVTPDRSATTFKVVSSAGHQGSFPIELATADTSGSHQDGASSSGSLQGLTWSSDNDLRLTKFAGLNDWLFEFRRIPSNLSSPAPKAVDSAMEQNCVLKQDGSLTACIAQDGSVYVAGGMSRGHRVFSASGFADVAPEESFNLGVGDSANTQGTTPSYTVTVKSINKNMITLRVTPPGGGWWDTAIQDGGYTTTPPAFAPTYAFIAQITNAKQNLVRVSVVKSNSGEGPTGVHVFDPALAWQPHGEGLVLVRRDNSGESLFLIQPGRGKATGHPASGQGPQWHLAAKASVSLPEVIDSMRFVTPSLLLLKTGSKMSGFRYSELPIHIANGQNNGKPSLAVGTVTPLPATIAVTMNGKSSQASVLDWSCKMP